MIASEVLPTLASEVVLRASHLLVPDNLLTQDIFPVGVVSNMAYTFYDSADSQDVFRTSKKMLASNHHNNNNVHCVLSSHSVQQQRRQEQQPTT